MNIHSLLDGEKEVQLTERERTLAADICKRAMERIERADDSYQNSPDIISELGAEELGEQYMLAIELEEKLRGYQE